MQRLTLQEMAARLRVDRKTFSDTVRTRGVPHIVVGRRKIFDPVVVEAHLAAVPAEPSGNVIKLQPRLNRANKKPKSRLAQAVGI
jgi:hypothetical protein